MRDIYSPFLIRSRFRICPPGTTDRTDERINLLMDRGAFGSGEHETTVSCLEWLESFPFSGRETILDLGSGTGILTIAALLLGGGQAWCVDIEPDAVDSCRRNCAHNDLEERVSHCCGTLESLNEEGFELVLANIYGDILLEIAETLVAKTLPGGRLLLSGILWEYNFDVRKKYQQLGCRLIKNRLLDEFSTVLLEKLT